MNDKSILRNIPQIEKLLQEDEVSKFIPILGHGVVVDIIRKVIELYRKKILESEDFPVEKILPSIVKNCVNKKQHKLQRVINGTGVIIHTNLGRSPLGRKAFLKLADELSGYCNVEYQLQSETRGKRGGYAEELISRLTYAEDALIVNNNASSVFLILNEFAKGREVIVSRGELIQIGGGFRIPDIMKQSGAFLVEVGTTNITELEDFAGAINSNTGMILSAHKSNYRIEGFSKNPSLRELSALKNDSILLVRDLGSGNLISNSRLPQPFEPVVGSELSQGADLICFSGDKLLGSCQAGIIIGKKELISKLRKNPLMRMIRVDKVTYFLLQEALVNYQNNNINEIILWDIILQDKKEISNKITRVIKKLSHNIGKKYISRKATNCAFGGGSLPGMHIDSFGLALDIPGISPEKLYSRFVQWDVPIIGSIIDDKFTLDFMAILDDDVPLIISALDDILNSYPDESNEY